MTSASIAPAANANENGSRPSISSTARYAMIAPAGCGALVSTAAQNCWPCPNPALSIGMATLVPSGTFWSAMARKMNSARPSVSDAKAVPIAKPSGRLCTRRTPNTSSERRTPAPRSSPTWTSRPASRRREPSRNRTPTSRPATTAPPPSSSKAGSSRPTTDATLISPTVVPQRKGRSWLARSPSRKTGTAPTPVANAVAVPASASTATSTAGLTVDQVVIQRVTHELGTARDAELLLDVRPVRLDGADAQEELLRDLAVGVPERDQAQHLDLAVAQLRERSHRAVRRGRHARAEVRVEPGTAARGGADGLHELGPRRVLKDVASRAGLKRLAGKRGIVLHRQDHHRGIRGRLGNLRDRLQARAARHVEIEHQYVGLVAERVALRLVDVAGLRHDLDAGFGLEQHP